MCPDPDRPDRKPAWWQPNSDFVRAIDRMIGGRARCWPDDIGSAMPWARSGLIDRIESWEIAGHRPFRWLRPKYRLLNRRQFAWSGANSESERRKAGRRLFEGLRALERENHRLIEAGEAPRHYHLIGHSHGGTVIWNALRLAAGRGESLRHLRSWATLGTPFPTFRPIRWRWLVGLLGLIVLAGTVRSTVTGWTSETLRAPGWDRAGEAVAALFSWGSPANLYPLGLSPATVVLVTILLALGAWFGFAVVDLGLSLARMPTGRSGLGQGLAPLRPAMARPVLGHGRGDRRDTEHGRPVRGGPDPPDLARPAARAE